MLNYLYLAGQARSPFVLKHTTSIYRYIYGKVHKGQCVSTPGGYFTTLLEARAQQYKEEKRLQNKTRRKGLRL